MTLQIERPKAIPAWVQAADPEGKVAALPNVREHFGQAVAPRGPENIASLVFDNNAPTA